jgi:hypothetical protein
MAHTNEEAFEGARIEELKTILAKMRTELKAARAAHDSVMIDILEEGLEEFEDELAELGEEVN